MSEKYIPDGPNSYGSMEGVENSDNVELSNIEEGGLVDDLSKIIKLQSLEPINLVTKVNLGLDELISKEHNDASDVGVSDAPFANFSFKYLKNNPEAQKKIIKYFKDKVVIDLGAGTTDFGLQIAKLLKCKGYIAVEPYFARNLAKKIIDERDIPVAVVSEDAVSFLRKIPEHSVSIITFGTDNLMFPDKTYNRELCFEIDRCTSSDGGCLNGDSILRPVLNKDRPYVAEFVGESEFYHY